MKAIFSDRAYLAILAETSEKISTETGGIFLGCFEDDTFYVVEAIDPGPKSTFQVAYFEYDQKYTEHLINKIARLYKHKLTLVGLWHRHPGSFDKFSSTDDGTNKQYSRLSDCGAISALVNIDPDFRLTVYHVGNPLRYQRIPHEVGDALIPNHIREMKNVEQSLAFINGYEKRKAAAPKRTTSKENLEQLIISIQPQFKAYSYSEEMNQVENESPEGHDQLTDILLDDLSFLIEDRGIILEIKREEKYITVSQKDGTGKLYFTYMPASKQIIFSFHDQCYEYDAGLFSQLLREKATDESGDKPSLKSDIIKFLGLDNLRW